VIDAILKDTRAHMQKTIDALSRELASIRTGRASPTLLEHVRVEYYGTSTPLNQLATINVPEPRMLTVQPWDKSQLKTIEKAILQSDLGLHPATDGALIRLPIPPLTQERRRDLAKLAKRYAEEAKVGIRNIRRDSKEHLERERTQAHVPEDAVRRAQDELQKITDKFIEEIDALLKKKESEIMEV
jgi:ribosome recycling factor